MTTTQSERLGLPAVKGKISTLARLANAPEASWSTPLRISPPGFGRDFFSVPVKSKRWKDINQCQPAKLRARRRMPGSGEDPLAQAAE